MSQKKKTSKTANTSKKTKVFESQLTKSQNDPEKDEAEVGIIESVSVKNFMCHDNLDFKFGPHVNFIIGRNGSGKSAILTAIVVGLGGKANITGRGTNLKGFIKNGKQTAEIAIKIRNCGPDAYKTELYGSSIVVERRITSDGSSSYKLKNEMGEIISTRREELVHMMDQFNIQIDNPVSVLNQETSRSFLNSKSSKDKYMFFLKATQLEQHSTLPELEKEVNEWKQKWEFYQSLKKQHEKLNHLRNEFAWAYVAVKERELNEKLRKLEEQKNNTPRFKSKVQESQEKLAEKLSEQQEIENKIKKMKEDEDMLQPQYNEARSQLAQENRLLNNKKLELRKVEKEISSLEKEITGLKTRIEELRKGDQKDYAAERQKRSENIRLLEEEKSELLAERKNIEFKQQKIEASLNKATEEMHNFRQQDRNIRHQIESLQQSIMNLESSRTNQLRRFGRYMPELLDVIDRYYKQNKFKEKPVGPIGICIKLKDAKWALAVESCLKSLVFAFCCDNHKDERTLQQLIRMTCNFDERKPSIIVSKFHRQVYNVNRYSVHSNKYSSVLQMLDITNPVVANCLIDQVNFFLFNLQSYLTIKLIFK
ncbi:structural maintenance of chromosomes protein 6-like [Centruroides sculpturatus]|uniref:structural maintenance of chromosomes protein 6-like n=1 Tax=Centruroides sculpturatus TaxID=218467 RepID=UPI000C6DB4FA|nr:structural maintenance of chromosomes protein 6-like [Centruroides sculpturatus]